MVGKQRNNKTIYNNNNKDNLVVNSAVKYINGIEDRHRSDCYINYLYGYREQAI